MHFSFFLLGMHEAKPSGVLITKQTHKQAQKRHKTKKTA
jgi:hypothetical protein